MARAYGQVKAGTVVSWCRPYSFHRPTGHFFTSMKNYRQKGDNLTVTLAAPVASGGVVVMTDIVGVAFTAGLAGQAVAVATEGVYTLPKVAGTALTAGQRVYWDAAAGNVTTTATGNKQVGYVTEPAASAATVVNVKLVQP